MKNLTIDNKTFTLINKNTKKAQQLLDQYLASHDLSVMDVYGCPSGTKRTIEEKILNYMYNNNMHGYKILSYCIMNFKCGYINDKYLFVETYANNYAIEL